MLVSTLGKVHTPGGFDPSGALHGHDRARAQEALLRAMPASEAVSAVTYVIQVEACVVAQCNNTYIGYIRTIDAIRFNLLTNGRFIIAAFPVSNVCRLTHHSMVRETAHATRAQNTMARVNALLAKCTEEETLVSKRASSIVVEVALRCPKCRTQDGIHRMSMQRTHSDEGMKIKCLCKGCGHGWEEAS
jgi:DNA-directed RNA polymerase subunit M/transcription elongation factor TFIIS